MASKDDRRAVQQRFAALDSSERRAIVKAVNRGLPVDKRKHAPFAVHIAERQMRFWRWSWLIGPVVGLLQIGQLGLLPAVINALVASAFLGAMSAFFWIRARRSREANLALSDGKRRAAVRPAEPERSGSPRGKRRWWGAKDTRPASTSSGRSPGGGHLPGERPTSSDGGEPGGPHGGQSSGQSLPPDRRPYQPRGKKRRRG
ncbi:MAG: hypothetical protein WD638_04005 [Nitriliruptoraceae bacterium]